MANLCDLLYEILLEIAKRLKNPKDFRSFRGVCKSLRAISKADYFKGLPLRQGIPYLLRPVKDKDDIREVYSLCEGESIVASVEFSDCKSNKCFESLGWLLVVGFDGTMSLLDPFSGIQIPVPHLNTFPEFDSLKEADRHVFIMKMVLSSRPSETSEFTLMIIAGSWKQQIGIWRFGDKSWNIIKDIGKMFIDVVYCGSDQFYAVTLTGYVWAFNLARNENHDKGPMIFYHGHIILPAYRNRYILKSANDSLLFITRESKQGVTKRFDVHEVDIVTGRQKEIHSLGSMTVFLGYSSTMALDASRFPGTLIKANRIYFTNDYWNEDTGVYNMETRAIESIYPLGEERSTKDYHSVWITPCV